MCHIGYDTHRRCDIIRNCITFSLLLHTAPLGRDENTLCWTAGMCEEHFLSPMPHILSMSVNPDTELRDRSCAPCNSSALGISCCGLCAFWVRRPQFRSFVQYLVSLLNSSLFKEFFK